MEKITTILISFLIINCSSAQETIKNKNFILSSDTAISLTVGGKLDRNNTVGKKVSYFWDLYQYYSPGFEPLQNFTLTNHGDKTIDSIKIVFNNQNNWQTESDLIKNLIPAGLTQKQQALMMWKLIYDNHVYYYKAENIVSPESNDLVKLLTVYGIADCYMSNVNLWLLNSLINSPDSSYYWGLNGGEHGVMETKIDGDFAILDADQGAFYLQLDNETLAGYDDIRMDEYLYIRSKRFTALAPYYSPKNYVDLANYLSSNNYRAKFGEYPVFHSSSLFSLRPGESIQYVFDSAKSYHQIIFQDNGLRPGDSNVLSFIGNGSFEYIPPITALQSYQKKSDNNLSCILPVTSPFVITTGQVYAAIQNPEGADFSVAYSTDLNNWTFLYQTADTGKLNIETPIDSAIGTLSKPAVYQYYIRLMWEGAVPSDVSEVIDSVNLSTNFQISKFYFPKLKIGNNSIKIESNIAEENALELDINWKENFENNPPDRVQQPKFPADNSVVNRLDITFEWPEATDMDKNEIIDYHFQLSDDSLMRYPLVSNYDIFLRNIDSVLKPQFHSTITDFLVAGKPYYWHVRALDSKGAWSDWSPVWKFVCNGPKQPLNFRLDTTANGYVLRWDRPENDNAVRFKIFAFTDRGFYPTYATYYDTTSDNEYVIPFDKKVYQFYRVAAIDAFGNQSATTKAINIRDSILLKVDETLVLDSISDNGYKLSYSVNENDFISLEERKITAKDKGKAIIQIHYINDLGRVVQTDQLVVIVKKPVLHIKPVDQEKKYGEDNPDFTLTISGLENGDDEAVLDSLPKVICTAEKYSPVGIYSLTLTGGGDNYYTYVFDTGYLNIQKNRLTISGDTITIKAGDPVPPLTFKVEGLLGDDDISAIDDLPVAQTSPDASRHSGNYLITFSGGADNNYDFEFSNGLLKVLPSQLVIYPNPSSGEFFFRIPEEMLGKTVRIFNESGKLIYWLKLNSIISKINLSNHPSGVYFFQLSEGSTVLQNGKFIIN